jgi:sterol desaturase/sphingolipid hydroxylase (fatty acid hydroxylase superfamily)
MDWLDIIGESCLDTALWLGGLMLLFGLLVYLMPCNRGMFWWKDLRGFGADLLYWFLMPLAGRVMRTALLAGGVALLFGDHAPGFAVLRELPLWLQCLAILLFQDVLLYWIHRGFHTAPAWRFHAIHHSPATLDWLAAARFHVVNYLFYVILADLIVLLLGFSTEALFALAPFNILYATMVHANLNWTFGPLRFVFASPVFHRWHHTLQASDRNFAPTFPFLDLIFGTFYMPAGTMPQHFGNGDADFPEDFWGQLMYPFRRTHEEPRPGSTFRKVSG